jgi:hypothetical protein
MLGELMDDLLVNCPPPVPEPLNLPPKARTDQRRI